MEAQVTIITYNIKFSLLPIWWCTKDAVMVVTGTITTKILHHQKHVHQLLIKLKLLWFWWNTLGNDVWTSVSLVIYLCQGNYCNQFKIYVYLFKTYHTFWNLINTDELHMEYIQFYFCPPCPHELNAVEQVFKKNTVIRSTSSSWQRPNKFAQNRSSKIGYNTSLSC